MCSALRLTASRVILISILLAGCNPATPLPPTSTFPPTSTATFTPIPPTDTVTATVTDNHTSTPIPATPTDTAIPPTATPTNTQLPLPTNTQAPATVAVQPTIAPTAVPALGPTVTGIHVVSRQSTAVIIGIEMSGLDTTSEYTVVAQEEGCSQNCPGKVHSGLFHRFKPTSSTWVEQLEIGIDSLFCQNGYTLTTTAITIKLAAYKLGSSFVNFSFPLEHTWCG